MKVEPHKHCWSEIGVWSSSAPTCPALQEVIHCRNCPVYTSQGRTLLERDIPTALRAEWTRQVAQPNPTESTLSESVLIFRLGDEHFAMATRFFEEVIAIRSVHTIPHRSGRVVKGFVAFRGRLELCVSMGSLLGVEKSSEEPGDSRSPLGGDKVLDGSRILVISRGEDSRFLFPVTAVVGTHRFPLETLQSATDTGAKHVFAYLKGIFPYQQNSVGLMDPDLIFEALSRSLTAR